MSICHDTARGLPDAGEGACCIGAAVDGPHRCTCWVEVFDLDQAPPLADADHAVRPQMCDDCAYRPGSPERAGDEHAAGDAELLERIAADAKPFWCHQGMRRPLAFRHEPTGTEMPADNVGGAELAYRPPIVDGRPFRADGTPADLCAGWDARRRALAAHSAKEKTA